VAVAGKPTEPPRQKKLPRQARSKFTVDVILDAAEQLLDQSGSLDTVTTRRVAARAGLSIGTLYDYIPNRDAILVELLNRRMSKHCEEMLPRLRGPLCDSLPELFLIGAEQAIEMDRALLRYGKDFHSRYARHFYFGVYYPEINSPGRKTVLGRIERSAVRLFSRKADAVRESDRELAAFIFVRALRGMMSTVIEERPELLDSPSLIPMLQRMMLAIVDFPAPSERDTARPGADDTSYGVDFVHHSATIARRAPYARQQGRQAG
jgi:AcrR family transcriptional regulator